MVVDRVNVVPELSLTYAISLKMSTSVDTIVTGKIHTKSKDVQGLEGWIIFKFPYLVLSQIQVLQRVSQRLSVASLGISILQVWWKEEVNTGSLELVSLREAGSQGDNTQVNCPNSIHSLGFCPCCWWASSHCPNQIVFSCFSNS